MDMHPTSDEAARRRTRDLVIRSYLEGALGLFGVFLIAAVMAPWLFNVRNDAAVIAAVLLWIGCPVLLFLLGSRVAGRWRRASQG
jgi:hypothetical protein